jgi:hypothetical protein
MIQLPGNWTQGAWRSVRRRCGKPMMGARNLWQFELFDPCWVGRKRRHLSRAAFAHFVISIPAEHYDTTIIPRALCRRAPPSFRLAIARSQ